MADFANLIQGAAGLFQQLRAADIVAAGAEAQAETIRQGGEIAAQGQFLAARGLRQSAVAVARSTEFNLAIDKINLQRQLQATSRQFQRTVGRQQVQQAGTGLNIASRSFLQLRNESADVFGRALLNFKLDAENTRRAKTFESQVKITNLENQARAAEFRGQAERVLASNRAAEVAFQGEIAQSQAIGKVVSGIPTLLSQVFQS